MLFKNFNFYGAMNECALSDSKHDENVDLIKIQMRKKLILTWTKSRLITSITTIVNIVTIFLCWHASAIVTHEFTYLTVSYWEFCLFNTVNCHYCDEQANKTQINFSSIHFRRQHTHVRGDKCLKKSLKFYSSSWLHYCGCESWVVWFW